MLLLHNENVEGVVVIMRWLELSEPGEALLRAIFLMVAIPRKRKREKPGFPCSLPTVIPPGRIGISICCLVCSKFRYLFKRSMSNGVRRRLTEFDL